MCSVKDVFIIASPAPRRNGKEAGIRNCPFPRFVLFLSYQLFQRGECASMKEKKSSALRFWLLVWGLGLIGQLVWNIENQWFNNHTT